VKYTVEVDDKGSVFWFRERTDTFHREDGPAIEYSNGNKLWYIGGQLHREDGPAILYPDGSTEWFFKGELHREDGPAVELSCGVSEWYKDGCRHRLDGPAVVYTNPADEDEYWIEGRYLTKEEFLDYLSKNPLNK